MVETILVANRGEIAVRVLRAIREAVHVPIIASGGGGTVEHFYDALTEGGADAVLAASVFHFGTVTIADLKQYLESRGVPGRPVAATA